MTSSGRSRHRELGLHVWRYGEGDGIDVVEHRAEVVVRRNAGVISEIASLRRVPSPQPDQFRIVGGTDAGRVDFARPEARADESESHAPTLERLPRLEDDFSGRAALVEQLHRVDCALEREPRAYQRAHEAGRDQPADLGVRFGHHVRTTDRELAPGRADDVDVVEQQPVDLDGRNLTTGEADDDQPTLLPQGPQTVGEAVTTDRIDNDVGAAELFRLVLPWPVRTQHL